MGGTRDPVGSCRTDGRARILCQALHFRTCTALCTLVAVCLAGEIFSETIKDGRGRNCDLLPPGLFSVCPFSSSIPDFRMFNRPWFH